MPVSDGAIGGAVATKRLEFDRAYRLHRVKSSPVSVRPHALYNDFDFVCTEMNSIIYAPSLLSPLARRQNPTALYGEAIYTGVDCE